MFKRTSRTSELGLKLPYWKHLKNKTKRQMRQAEWISFYQTWNLENVCHQLVGRVQVHLRAVEGQSLGPALSALKKVGPVAGRLVRPFNQAAVNLKDNETFKTATAFLNWRLLELCPFFAPIVIQSELLILNFFFFGTVYLYTWKIRLGRHITYPLFSISYWLTSIIIFNIFNPQNCFSNLPMYCT